VSTDQTPFTLFHVCQITWRTLFVGQDPCICRIIVLAKVLIDSRFKNMKIECTQFICALVALVLVVNAQDYSLSIDKERVYGSKLITHYQTTKDRHDTRDWIGLFYNGTCLEKSDCQIAYAEVAGTWDSKTVVFEKLQVTSYDIRYMKRDGILSSSTMVARLEFQIAASPGMHT
jgi:hypothetical protein